MKKFVALLLLIAVMVPTIAFATTPRTFGTFSFTSTGKNDTEDTETRAKGDSEFKWYITLESASLLSANNCSSSNILGVRPRILSNGESAGSYVKIKSLVTGQGYRYNNNDVTQGTEIFLRMKKDDSSTTTETLLVKGRFVP